MYEPKSNTTSAFVSTGFVVVVVVVVSSAFLIVVVVVVVVSGAFVVVVVVEAASPSTVMVISLSTRFPASSVYLESVSIMLDGLLCSPDVSVLYLQYWIL